MKKSLLLCFVLCLCATNVFAGRHYRRHNTSTMAVTSTVVTPAEPQKEFDSKDAEKVEEELLNAINAERKRYGLLPLVIDNWLQLRARIHCNWMTRTRNMVHSSDPCAENIAMGQRTVADVVRAWMNSSGHRANILNGGHLRTGVSCYSSNGTLYWCQQFRHGE